MLLEIATAVRAQLRSHDLLTRYGGDEFVCVMSDETLAGAAERLALACAALADSSEHTITVGIAAMQPGDGAAELLARADGALYRMRRRGRGGAQPS